MKQSAVIFIGLFLLAQAVNAQQKQYSRQMAQTAMNLWKDSFSLNGNHARWSYDQGVILKGIEGVWKLYGDATYFNYIQHSMDFYVQEDGTIKDYKKDEFNIDYLNNGKLLLLLYNVTGEQKYKRAIDNLRAQLDSHPRTKEGSFWHKGIYPWQVWLDGLYMGQPFYAEYAKHAGQSAAFDDIASQFINIERHTRDHKTGLLFHGWDESKNQPWANKQTGTSPHFWARAMGWYAVALVDVLDYFPANHPARDSIIGILNRLVKAVTAVQDPGSGLWYDILDLPKKPKNYKEASASCMFVYSIAKGVRNGYVPQAYLQNAKKGYAGIIKEFIEVDGAGQTNLKGTVSVSGLGGKPYRDGSFDYYMSEPVIVNDPKGIGAFIMCAVEMEMAALPKPGKGKQVLLDGYFNNEWKKNLYGTSARWHYTWDEMVHAGFSLFGDIFKSYGARLATLGEKPTAARLKSSAVYIIVDPDGLKDNNNPNYVDDKDVKIISEWVKAGGVLLLMANDSANCDLGHFNKLANTFGINFSGKSINMVKGDEFETGPFIIIKPTLFSGKLKKCT